MKHAGQSTIEGLAELREQIGACAPLKETKPGIFYYKSRAFLHFHEDGDKIYADVRLTGDDFERFPCSTRKEQASLVKAIRQKFS